MNKPMNNFTITCFELIADTFLNRPKKYSAEEKNILYTTIEQQKQEVELQKDNISEGTCETLLEMYELLRKRIESGEI